MNNTASAELADPALGDNIAHARRLLFAGADVSYGFYAAVQNAATGGHQNVLKLVLAADPDFHESKQDALRAAGRAGQAKAVQLLCETADNSTNATRFALRHKFVSACHENREEDAAQALNCIVALMFPTSPKLS